LKKKGQGPTAILTGEIFRNGDVGCELSLRLHFTNEARYWLTDVKKVKKGKS
jgi:hypothetical protein